jgi:two-component system, NtrC family, sensor kinase
MLLEKRIKLVLLGLLVFLISGAVILHYAIIYRTFTGLEQNRAREDVQRCFDAVQREGYHLEILVNDWSSWDDMYRFVQDQTPEFEKQTFTLKAIESIDLNLVCLTDQSNTIIRCIGLDNLTKNSMTIQAFSQPTLPADHPLLIHSDKDHSARILRTERGVMLVDSGPVLPTDGQGPPRGTLIMGRFFSDVSVEMLVQQTHVRFMAWNLSSNSLPAKIREVLTRISPDKPLIETNPSTDMLQGYMVLNDIYGQPALLIDASIPRTITALGQESTLYTCVWLLMLIAIVWASLLGFLNRSVIWPIQRLQYRAKALNPEDNPSHRIPVQRNDEIGSLAMAFNGLLDRLAEEQKSRRKPGKPVQETPLAETRV